MSGDLVLAIDQGTHATRAIVFDHRGHPLAQALQPVELHMLSADEVEQDAGEILASAQAVMAQVLADPALAGRLPRTAGLATQRSSVVAWRRSDGTALAPLLSWQDRRSADYLASLADTAADTAQRTGLRLSPHYGAGKLHWLLEHNRAVQAALADDDLLMGPLASFLLYHLLTDRPALVDDANAARTLLWNLATRDWDPLLLKRFGVPRAVLPECRPIAGHYGTLSGGGVPLHVVNGDQTAALYAQGRPPDQTLFINIGTGAFVLVPVPDPASRPPGLLAGISCSEPGISRYYLEGTVNGAGAALSWAQQSFGAIDFARQLPVWLASIGDPCLFINTVGGLGAPWWRPGKAAYFTRDDITAEEAMVAVIESILFLLQVNIRLLRDTVPGIAQIRVSGGLAVLDGLCQRLADLSGLPVERPVQQEATARGTAWLAAGCPEDWPPGGPAAHFEPRVNEALAARYRQFVAIIEAL